MKEYIGHRVFFLDESTAPTFWLWAVPFDLLSLHGGSFQDSNQILEVLVDKSKQFESGCPLFFPNFNTLFIGNREISLKIKRFDGHQIVSVNFDALLLKLCLEQAIRVWSALSPLSMNWSILRFSELSSTWHDNKFSYRLQQRTSWSNTSSSPTRCPPYSPCKWLPSSGKDYIAC